MESNSNNYSSTFTIHALAGYSNSLTMRVNGFIKHQPMMVLTDNGSTNNFMDIGITKQLSLPLKPCKKFEVTLVDGRILYLTRYMI